MTWMDHHEKIGISGRVAEQYDGDSHRGWFYDEMLAAWADAADAHSTTP